MIELTWLRPVSSEQLTQLIVLIQTGSNFVIAQDPSPSPTPTPDDSDGDSVIGKTIAWGTENYFLVLCILAGLLGSGYLIVRLIRRMKARARLKKKQKAKEQKEQQEKGTGKEGDDGKKEVVASVVVAISEENEPLKDQKSKPSLFNIDEKAKDQQNSKDNGKVKIPEINIEPAKSQNSLTPRKSSTPSGVRRSTLVPTLVVRGSELSRSNSTDAPGSGETPPLHSPPLHYTATSLHSQLASAAAVRKQSSNGSGKSDKSFHSSQNEQSGGSIGPSLQSDAEGSSSMKAGTPFGVKKLSRPRLSVSSPDGGNSEDKKDNARSGGDLRRTSLRFDGRRPSMLRGSIISSGESQVNEGRSADTNGTGKHSTSTDEG